MSAFAGYEYEDWLLNQWGIWARGGGYNLSGSHAGESDQNCSADDPTMEKVDSIIAKMDRAHKSVIKNHYLTHEEEVEDDVSSAIRRFAGNWYSHTGY